jgi:hypothetical protein
LPLLLLLFPALVFLTFASEARAQTECNPPCAVGDQCVDGRCYAGAGQPPAPETAPAPAAASPVPEPTPPVVVPVPPPPPTRRPRARRRERAETEDEVKVDDVEGIPPRRRGLLAIPFLGVHSIQGLAAEDFGIGARVGTLLGVHVDPLVSLNVEVAVDILNPRTKLSGVSSTGHDLTIAFSPLFHVAGDAAELVMGPKVGYWSENFTTSDLGTVTRDSQWGWAIGGNIGGFASVNEHVAIGLLVTYQFIAPSLTCTHGPLDDDRGCSQAGAFPPEILGITGAALF